MKQNENQNENRNYQNPPPGGSWQQALVQAVAAEKGASVAAHFASVILPNITADFLGMLRASHPGIVVREDYHLDDGSLSVHLEGLYPDRVTAAAISGGRLRV